MKKLLIITALLTLLAAPAWADWSVTVTWTKSVGPDLAYEQVLYNGEQKCSVQAAIATCNFTLPTLGGDVVVRSYNSQGAYSETAPLPVADVPAPATGVVINVTYVQP